MHGRKHLYLLKNFSEKNTVPVSDIGGGFGEDTIYSEGTVPAGMKKVIFKKPDTGGYTEKQNKQKRSSL